jgi:AAA domain
MTGAIDFEGINETALRNTRALVQKLVPGGKFRSLQYIVRNPRRDDKTPGSFTINYRSGLWKDFATSDGGGDLISLVAYLRGVDQGAAARELADMLGVPFLKSNGQTKPSDLNGGSHKVVAAGNETPKVRQWGEEGPPQQCNEIRRHYYPRGSAPKRKVKVKRKGESEDSWVTWYRFFKNGVPVGWQAKKPDDYVAIPYITEAFEPFDAELRDDEILWPEGEKDVDSLGSINIPAFTFGGGGDGLPGGIGSFLKDRHIVIIADNDDPGRAHSEKKAAAAHDAGATSIKIIHFPELPPKGDVSDFLTTGGTAEQLTARIDAAPTWSPPRPVAPQGWRGRIVTANDLQTMTFAPVRHILYGYIVEGVTILAGKPKSGKSFLALDVCIGASADRFTLGTLKPVQGDVLCLALEDTNHRLRRRMAKLWPSPEAEWPRRLSLATEWRRANQGGLEDIEDWCRTVSSPVLVWIDTLEKFRPIQTSKDRAYSADYEAIAGLHKIAAKFNVAIVVNHHVRKMDADDPFDTVSGTLGLTGAADTILVLRRHAGAVTLHARGRDIEEAESAMQFSRDTCRWTILGAASDVHVSSERAAVIRALAGADPAGLAVSEIIAATGSTSRGAMDTLLFKMKESGDIVRLQRGVYALAQDAGKIGQKDAGSKPPKRKH